MGPLRVLLDLFLWGSHMCHTPRKTQCSSQTHHDCCQTHSVLQPHHTHIHSATIHQHHHETQFSCSSQEYHHDETGIPAISHHTQCIVPAPYFFKTQCSSYTNTMRPGAGQWSSNSHTLCYHYHVPAAKQHQHETQECTNRSHINITSQDLG